MNTTHDTADWDTPLGKGHEGPSIISTVRKPDHIAHVYKLPHVDHLHIEHIPTGEPLMDTRKFDDPTYQHGDD